MKRLAFLFTAAVCIAGAGPAAAQSYSAKSTYPNPDGNMALFRNNPCQDPWVTIAVQIVYGTANAARCPIHLYNNGRWNSFNQLVHAVAAYKKKMSAEALTMSPRWLEGTNLVVPVMMDSNTGAIVAAGAGNLISNGTNIISNNGANIISNNGANIIGNNGAGRRPATLIGPDGATLISNQTSSIRAMSMADYRAAPKVSAATGYVTMSTRTIRLPGGNMLVVK